MAPGLLPCRPGVSVFLAAATALLFQGRALAVAPATSPDALAVAARLQSRIDVGALRGARHADAAESQAVRARDASLAFDPQALAEEYKALAAAAANAGGAPAPAPAPAPALALAAAAARASRKDGIVAQTEGLLTSYVHVFLYLLMFAFVGCIVAAVYGKQGASVVSRIYIYLGAMSTIKLSVKLVYNTISVPCAKFLCASHFTFCTALAFAILFYRARAVRKPMDLPSFREFVGKILPIAMATSTSVVANNLALLSCSVSLTEIIASTSPAVSLGVMLVRGRTFSKWLLVPVVLVVIGCWVSTSWAMNGFSIVGVAFCVISLVSRGVKVVLQEEVLRGELGVCTDPCTLLAWIFLPSAAVMLAWSLFAEGLGPITQLTSGPDRLVACLYVALSCANACCLNLSALWVVKDLGAIGGQLVAPLKAGLVLLGASVLFHDVLNRMQIFGFVMVLSGVVLYENLSFKAVKT